MILLTLLIITGVAGAGWIGWRVLRQPSPPGGNPTVDNGTNWLASDFSDDRPDHRHGHHGADDPPGTETNGDSHGGDSGGDSGGGGGGGDSGGGSGGD